MRSSGSNSKLDSPSIISLSETANTLTTKKKRNIETSFSSNPSNDSYLLDWPNHPSSSSSYGQDSLSLFYVQQSSPNKSPTDSSSSDSNQLVTAVSKRPRFLSAYTFEWDSLTGASNPVTGIELNSFSLSAQANIGNSEEDMNIYHNNRVTDQNQDQNHTHTHLSSSYSKHTDAMYNRIVFSYSSNSNSGSGSSSSSSNGSQNNSHDNSQSNSNTNSTKNSSSSVENSDSNSKGSSSVTEDMNQLIASSHRSPLLILVVDDSVIQRKLSEFKLTGSFNGDIWQVLTAENGETALQLCQSSSRRPDVIIIDQNMSSAGGRLLGHEVVASMRGMSNFKDVVIIGCTGFLEDAEKRFIEAGCDAVWKKPMPPKFEAFAEIITKRHLRMNGNGKVYSIPRIGNSSINTGILPDRKHTKVSSSSPKSKSKTKELRDNDSKEVKEGEEEDQEEEGEENGDGSAADQESIRKNSSSCNSSVTESDSSYYSSGSELSGVTMSDDLDALEDVDIEETNAEALIKWQQQQQQEQHDILMTAMAPWLMEEPNPVHPTHEASHFKPECDASSSELPIDLLEDVEMESQRILVQRMDQEDTVSVGTTNQFSKICVNTPTKGI